MATTATVTLNGGPTGGLHATTIIHSEESQQGDTCRVDSNSSFDSGHDELQNVGSSLNLEDTSMSNWPSCSDRNSAQTNMESGGFSNDPSMSKKRRKQSRPVRIPASEVLATAPMSQRAEAGGCAEENPATPMSPTHPNENYNYAERTDEGEESEESGEENKSHFWGRHSNENDPRDSGMRIHHHHHHHQAPLNLSSSNSGRNGDGGSVEGNVTNSGQFHLAKEGLMEMDRVMVGNEKTELGGQGTKDSQRNSNPSFPPAPLLPLIGSSQFFSFFPNGQAAGTQQTSSSLPVNLQMQPQQAGTPSSSSSVGSNGNQQLGGSLLNTTSSSSNPLQNIPPHRIFNPEAYCDLCNKEFCNKYFLKTHKANKHGVYTEGPATSAVMPPSQVMAAAAALTTTIPTSPSAPFIGIGQAMIQPQATINQPPVVPAPSNLNLNLKTGCKTELPSQGTRPTLSMDMKGVIGGGREAFCNMCQKEFCNKYFLKRHKAKIHGIPMESLPQRPASKSSRPGCSNGAEKNSLLLPSDLELSLEIVKHMDTSGGIEEGELVKGERHENLSGHTSPGQEPRMRLSGSILREQQSEDEQQQQNSQGDDLRLKLSPAATAMKIPIGLTHFGASAASLSENTCQFCLREFSSKSQLRSHLTKKHRLLLPTFPPFLLPFPGMGSSLLDESSSPQAMAASAECDSFEQSDNCPKEEADYECTLCGRSFQTVYLLRMHKSYFHPESEDSLAAISVSHEARNRIDESSDMDSGDNTPAPPNNNTGDSNKGSSLGIMGEGEGEPEAETTSDSDDLRRLQTMILELNRASSNAQSASWSPPPEFVGPGGAIALTGADLSTTSSGPTVCTICSKEFYSSYFLQQHIQHYHSSSAGEAGSKDKDDSTSKKTTSELFEGKTSPSIQVHREKTKETVSSVNSDVNVPLPLAPPSSFLAPGPKNCSSSSGVGGSRDSSAKSDGNSAKRPSPSLSRSYCTICHKELCNKYFMRTHMLKMHGISIESSTGLGGVTCDICNKELCSKYFLKVHKQNTHGIVDEGPSPPNPSTPGPLPPPPPAPSSTSAEPVGAMTQTGELSQVLTANQPGGDAGSRYLCHYSEVCTFCGRRFRSPKWLKTHLMSDHGQEGKDKWKVIEKSLQQQQSRKQSKGGSSGGMSSSKSSSGKSSSKSKSSSSSVSAGQLGIASNGSNGNKCALCGFTTQDVEVMKVHLMKEHANQLGTSETGAVGMSYGDAHRVVLDPLALLFQKMEDGSNKLYRCAYCPFATTLLVYLYAHERTHTGLANSVTASQQQQQQPQSQATSNDGASFQCPLCFHTFQQVDAFQQHLLGHQMSGVLAPFFNPPTSPPPSRFPFPAPKSPTSLEQQQQQQQQPILPAFSSALSMLNGAISGSSDGLYWALKNSATAGSRGERQTPDLRLSDVLGQDERTTGKETMDAAMESGHRRRESGSRGLPAGPQDPGHADEGSGMVEDEADDDNDENDETLLLSTNAQEEKFRKRRKLSRFRCSCCSACFISRRECFNHIQQNHSKKQKRNFRCRKCKFVSSQYQRLIIHSRVHHIKRRGFQSENLDAERRIKLKNWGGRDDKGGSGIGTGLPQGRAIPQQGVLGDYVMQSFLLCCSSDDEKSSGSRKGDGGDDGGAGGGEDDERQHGKRLRTERLPVLKEDKRKEEEEATVEDENEIDQDGQSRNNNNGSFLEKIQSDLFVPSLVYLPVREKVSQSLRVSFSLTPTS